MKPFLILLSLAMSLSLAGELQQLHRQVNPTAADSSPSKTEGPGGLVLVQPMIAELSNPGIDEIGIERGRCLAGCPAYTLIIAADGSFRYYGEYGVERLGDHSGSVSVGRLNQVMRFMNEALFPSFDSSYRSVFLDAATVYTMMRRGNEITVVENYANSGPASLWAIEQLIDSLLETASWD